MQVPAPPFTSSYTNNVCALFTCVVCVCVRVVYTHVVCVFVCACGVCVCMWCTSTSVVCVYMCGVCECMCACGLGTEEGPDQ